MLYPVFLLKMFVVLSVLAVCAELLLSARWLSAVCLCVRAGFPLRAALWQQKTTRFYIEDIFYSEVIYFYFIVKKFWFFLLLFSVRYLPVLLCSTAFICTFSRSMLELHAAF